MSIFDKIVDKLSNEFVDIIDFLDDTQDTMVYRFPRYQNEIKNGAKLIVRDSQVALLVNEGRIADLYQPGTHTLTTSNMPIMTTIMGWKYGFNSPFKAEVYFFNTKNFTNLGWGTSDPIPIPHPQFVSVDIKARGTYSIKIADPAVFYKEIVGTDGHFTTDEVTDQLRSFILRDLTKVLASTQTSIFQISLNYDLISAEITEKLKPDFKAWGLELSKFVMESHTLPEKMKQAIEAKQQMQFVGDLDMNQFVKFQGGNAMQTAAENGGVGGVLGVGMMGGMMGGMQSAPQQAPQPAAAAPQAGPPPLPTQSSYFVAVNGAQSGPFDMATLAQMIQSGAINKDSLVWKQGMAAWSAANTVTEISSIFNQVPPPLPS